MACLLTGTGSKLRGATEEVRLGGVTAGRRGVAAKTTGGRSTDRGDWSDCGSVSDVPETRFTHSADGVRLAYQVSGEGPLNLVFLRDEAMPLDLMRDDPWFLRLSKGLGAFSRTVWNSAIPVQSCPPPGVRALLRRFRARAPPGGSEQP
jgi:hypothetical protein